MTLGDKASSFTAVTHHRGTFSQYFILFQENISNSFQVVEWKKIYYGNHYNIFGVQRAITPKVGSIVKVY